MTWSSHIIITHSQYYVVAGKMFRGRLFEIMKKRGNAFGRVSPVSFHRKVSSISFLQNKQQTQNSDDNVKLYSTKIASIKDSAFCNNISFLIILDITSTFWGLLRNETGSWKQKLNWPKTKSIQSQRIDVCGGTWRNMMVSPTDEKRTEICFIVSKGQSTNKRTRISSEQKKRKGIKKTLWSGSTSVRTRMTSTT